jgi:transposase
MNVTLHINAKRHESMQRARRQNDPPCGPRHSVSASVKRVEQVFGWGKVVCLIRKARGSGLARRLKPFIKLAKTLKSHPANILNYLRIPITNAAAEGLNSKIQLIKYRARGYRNADRFARLKSDFARPYDAARRACQGPSNGGRTASTGSAPS